METLELDDIQGYIIRGYGHMQYSRFVLLNVKDAANARQWLKEIEDRDNVFGAMNCVQYYLEKQKQSQPVLKKKTRRSAPARMLSGKK